ncbi:MAG: J domain-containing protein [Acidimicrobiia bacterium]|nr:J domain-containing protein [Acidimicrobiia bacterium]
MLGLGGWPVARHCYHRARTKLCNVCKVSTLEVGGVCRACLLRQDGEQRRREQEAAEERTRTEQEARRRPEQQRSRSAHQPPIAPDPDAILGVQRSATQEQIRAAYRALIVQYHPDKVAQLGPELRQLAAQKTQQINDAYRSLRR